MKGSAKEASEYERYFVAIIPPKHIAEQIHLLKVAACERFGSCAALKSPPHITLHMPFRWKNKKENELIRFFEQFKFGHTPAEIVLRGIDHFGNRVIYLSVEKNPTLSNLQNTLTGDMRKRLGLINAS
ncbi:MAG: 2'-5' RNA ligase family protein, partial [Cyclobacteriaceae bacterium]